MLQDAKNANVSEGEKHDVPVSRKAPNRCACGKEKKTK